MRLQHGKCAYCERQLESEEYGRIEHDLEHFRPKKNAKPWKLSETLQEAGIDLTTAISGKSDPGYHLLAYHPLNYCTSCKTCNSRLKSDYFPIVGIRHSGGSDPIQMSYEEPLLVNPLGSFDDNPSSLISFHGLSPMACGDTDYKKHRGLVCIDFFRLDDRQRKYLFRERAFIITSIYSYLKLTEQTANPGIKQIYEGLVEVMTKPSAPHSNCARCFRDLYVQDQDEAVELVQHAAAYMQSISS